MLAVYLVGIVLLAANLTAGMRTVVSGNATYHSSLDAYSDALFRNRNSEATIRFFRIGITATSTVGEIEHLPTSTAATASVR